MQLVALSVVADNMVASAIRTNTNRNSFCVYHTKCRGEKYTGSGVGKQLGCNRIFEREIHRTDLTQLITNTITIVCDNSKKCYGIVIIKYVMIYPFINCER